MIEYMLGSHNSLSYLPIKHWWHKFTIPWSRCQKLTLQEQYDAGVRLFDIRIRFDKNGNIQFCHNNIIYKYSLQDFYNDIKKFEEKTFYRFVLDYRKKPSNSVEILSKFTTFINKFSWLREEVVVNNAIVFWLWTDYVEKYKKLNTAEHTTLYEIYSSVSGTFYKYLPVKLFANIVYKTLNNIPIKKVMYSTDCLLLDYIRKKSNK